MNPDSSKAPLESVRIYLLKIMNPDQALLKALSSLSGSVFLVSSKMRPLRDFMDKVRG